MAGTNHYLKKIILVWGILFGSISVSFAQDPLSPEMRLKLLNSVIVAPKEVFLAQSRSIPILVQVVSPYAEAPESVTIHAGWGNWDGTRSNDLNLKLQGGIGWATLSLVGATNSLEVPLKIWLSTTKTHDPIGKPVEIKLHWPGIVEIMESSPTVKANGYSKGTIKVRVTDQYGEAMSNVACMLRYGHPDRKLISLDLAYTDAKGYAVFTIFPETNEGTISFQAATESHWSPPGKMVFIKN